MKDAEKFGKYLGEIAEEAAQAMGENNVPFFLQNPIQTLHNLTPIQLVWFYGEIGRDKVLNLLKEAESGFAV